MIVQSFGVCSVEIKRSVIAKVAQHQSQGLCLACGKPLHGRVVRGCHIACHQATLRAIAAGKTTDEQRVKEGKWLPASNGGRKPTNPVTMEFAE